MKNSKKLSLTTDQVKELKTLCAAAKAAEEAKKTRYTRIETSVYKDRNLGMEAAKPRYGRTKKRLSGSSPIGVSHPADGGYQNPLCFPMHRAWHRDGTKTGPGNKNERKNHEKPGRNGKTDEQLQISLELYRCWVT